MKKGVIIALCYLTLVGCDRNKDIVDETRTHCLRTCSSVNKTWTNNINIVNEGYYCICNKEKAK